jgi:protocatechuate 3,4-dioxygenase beta subunit
MKRTISLTLLTLGFLNLAHFGSSQTASAQTQAVSIAILNFQDDTGANAPAALGQKLARDLHQKIATGYRDLLPRLVTAPDASAKELTLDQIAALAKQSGAKYVVRGGLLALTSEPAGSDSKVTAQLYADIVSADNAAVVATVRAEGSGVQTGAAPQLPSLDVSGDQFPSSGVGQALAGAVAQLADLIHQAVTGGAGAGSAAGGAQTTTTAQPDASQAAAQADAAKSAEADADLQQLITQAETLLSSGASPNGQNANAAGQALQALKSALEAKAALMQSGQDTSQADQQIAAQRQALQAAVAQLTADAAAASATGTVATNTQQTPEQKKGFLQKVNDFASQALTLLQNIQQMRSALQGLTESSANTATTQTGNGSGTGDTSVTEQQLGECNGVVTDQNGNAVPNAQVADQTSGASAATDANGQYDLKGLPANQTAVLTVTAGGQTLTAQTPITAGRIATLDFQFKPNAGDPARPVIPPVAIVKTAPGTKIGSLKGVVSDQQGRPVARALVTLKGLAIARTDAGGQFQFLNVPVGTQQLSVNRIGLRTKTATVKVTAAESADASVQFTANDRLAPPPQTPLLDSTSGGTVGGAVFDNRNQPLAWAKVSLIQAISVSGNRNQPSALSTFTNPQGEFVLNNVKPGQYLVSASKVGYDPSHQNVRLGPGVGTSVQFRLSPQSSRAVADFLNHLTTRRITIRGRVLGRDGSAITNATVALKRGGVTLTSTNTNPSGEYQLSVDPGQRSVVPDKYEVRASADPYLPASQFLEARSGATAPVNFNLSPRRADDPLDTRTEFGAAGSLEGQVSDALTNRPVAGASVSLLIQQRSQRTQTDRAGKFTFSNLLPLPRPYQLAVSMPGYSPVQQAVSIQPGRTVSVRLTLRPTRSNPSKTFERHGR